jgi:hypothetical protein
LKELGLSKTGEMSKHSKISEKTLTLVQPTIENVMVEKETEDSLNPTNLTIRETYPMPKERDPLTL